MIRNELKKQTPSMPRDPVLIKLFRFAKLSENAGYGIHKMLTWEKLTHKSVEFSSGLDCSTPTYFRKNSAGVSRNAPESHLENLTERQLDLLNHARERLNTSIAEMVANVESATTGGVKHNIDVLKQKSLLAQVGSDKGGHWEVVKGI